ncbi:hypothetical protein GNI_153740 [Gregarina niphandrodes]|uniref:Uncharacterized protein n=1 Tax=Gregarina niphandrodes TaxID=110365 RepID=A0A023AZD6_GRENI|nr:hypothetical protein GNI_153740 [Gregarina niphandrodes]EZG44022.1 hypothetical protein GNI_153740 [Gregarina niphandrodes]|eukprot:XP_011132839.1 hypothetical protein GNI_153740 [Gregarina niphandrodes]
MRTLKSGASGLRRFDLLLMVRRLYGGRTMMDDYVARVVTIHARGGEATFLALGPKAVAGLSGVGPGWFRRYHRMILWSPKGAPANDPRAEAALVSARLRFVKHEYKALDEVGLEGNDPELVYSEGDDPKGDDPEGDDPEGDDPEGDDPEGDDPEENEMLMVMSRPVYKTELKELQLMPKDWWTVVKRSAVVKPTGKHLDSTTTMNSTTTMSPSTSSNVTLKSWEEIEMDVLG